METFKDRMPDDRNASLSMAWANWKFLGCHYHPAVQSLLQELDSELPSDIKEMVEKKPAHGAPTKVNFVAASSSNKKPFVENRSSPDTIIIKGLTIYEPENGEGNAVSILNESAQKSKKTIEFQDLGSKMEPGKNEPDFSCAAVIDEKLVATGSAKNKKDAKRDAATKALEILKKSQPCVTKKLQHDDVSTVEKGDLVKAAYHSASKIDESNVGNQLLRKMGWTGSGGLGKDGISEPIFVDGADGRKGLGQNDTNKSIKRSSVEDVLMKFIREQKEEEIKFSNDLSKDERALIHRISQKYGLKHKSFGTGEKRYLVISRK